MTATVAGQLLDLKVYYFARRLGSMGLALGWPSDAEGCPEIAKILARLTAHDPLRAEISAAYEAGYRSLRDMRAGR